PEHAPYRTHPIDRLYLKEAVKFTDQFVRDYCGSPSGHYMTGHPNNILLVPMLTKELAHAKFVLLIRDPLETLTSMINAPYAVEAGWRANRDEVSDAEIGALVEIWRSRARIVIEAPRSGRRTRAGVRLSWACRRGRARRVLGVHRSSIRPSRQASQGSLSGTCGRPLFRTGRRCGPPYGLAKSIGAANQNRWSSGTGRPRAT